MSNSYMPHQETHGERQVRKYLEAQRIPFRQEELVFDYIVDFLVGETLVVEVDGVWHLARHKSESDARKDARLKAAGYEVLRIPAEELRYDGLCRKWLKQIQQAWKTRHADACRVSSLSPATLQALMELKRSLA
jgi:very-short-patch-repair endonuclease